MGRIRIRAHHLDSFSRFSSYNLENLGRVLVSQNYTNTPDHPFVAYVHRVFQKMRQPTQRVLVVIGEEDIICRRCPKRSNCETLHPEKSMLANSVFHVEDYIRGEKDKTIAADYKVKHKCEYSSEEIFLGV
jgi:hypothetical protein